MLLSSKISIRVNAKGRAVYACKDIKRGETIEVCPVIVVHPSFAQMRAEEPPIGEWAFEFNGEAVIALGAGSLYNHALWPNATWRLREVQRHRYIEFRASAPIATGEEICIHYCDSPGDEHCELGFKVIA